MGADGDPIHETNKERKRRVFAIGNWVNQRLLSPIHDWAAGVLRCLRTDGTFDQARPLRYLIGGQWFASYDLSSATDRWPLVVIYYMVSVLFDPSFASASINGCLATNIFRVPFIRDVRESRKLISFIAGQPLGYRGSWPLFALSHHMIIWWAAEKVMPGVKFRNYAVLGDDVVIGDERVAHYYKYALEMLQVKISLTKSLISSTGALEFAKRFYVKSASVDLSPVSMQALLGVHLPMDRYALAFTYSVKRWSTFLKLGGMGYKASSCLKVQQKSRKSRMCGFLWDLIHSPSIELYLGGGVFLPPEIFWYCYRELLRYRRPRQLLGLPEDSVVTDNQLWFLEYTSVRNWVESYLTTQSRWWYHYRVCHNYISYDGPSPEWKYSADALDLVLDIPVPNHSWKVLVRREDRTTFSFLVKMRWKLLEVRILLIGLSTITYRDVLLLCLFRSRMIG